MMGIAIGNKSPMIIQIGKIKQEDPQYLIYGKQLKYADFARGKVLHLQNNIGHTKSSQNLDLRPYHQSHTYFFDHEIVAGGVRFNNEVIIAISGLSSNAIDDENAVLAIGQKMGFKETTSNIA